MAKVEGEKPRKGLGTRRFGGEHSVDRPENVEKKFNFKNLADQALASAWPQCSEESGSKQNGAFLKMEN